MPPGALHGRRDLDVLFGLFLATGVMVGAYFVWAVADWIHSQGEGAFGLLYLGIYSFVPAVLAWVAGGVHQLMTSKDRDVRLGLALTTGHFVWWFLVLGIGTWRHDPWSGWAMRIATIIEPGCYAVGVTVLAARWFWWRRRHDLR